MDLMERSYYLLIIFFQVSSICTLQQILFIAWFLLSLFQLLWSEQLFINQVLNDSLRVWNCLQIFVSKPTLELSLTTLNIYLDQIPIHLLLMFWHIAYCLATCTQKTKVLVLSPAGCYVQMWALCSNFLANV